MNIKIMRNGLRKDEVFFVTDHGEGRGIWCGPSVMPGSESDVEFELTELLMRWVDILPVTASEFGIRIEDNKVVFRGVLENIEADGTGYLRFGEGLIMFECLGEPMALGVFVELHVNSVRIYPVSY
jgi:hypothetical protein